MLEHPVLYREDLDWRHCAAPGCRHTPETSELVLAGRCCGAKPTVATYRADVVTLSCSVCRQHVASIAVASRRGRA